MGRIGRVYRSELTSLTAGLKDCEQITVNADRDATVQKQERKSQNCYSSFTQVQQPARNCMAMRTDVFYPIALNRQPPHEAGCEVENEDDHHRVRDAGASCV